MSVRRTVEFFASLKLTLVALTLLGVGVIAAYFNDADKTWPLALPLGLLALNLVAAIAARPALRTQAPLLVFHLALLVLIVLLAAGRLSYLTGWVKLVEGEQFAGRLGEVTAGPLHNDRLREVSFSHSGFSIDYRSGMRRGQTRNRVHYLDSRGVEQEAMIGDQTPLVLEGYRFYTSSNKGFAPIFLWQPAGGEPQAGSLMLPSYPINDFNQTIEWTPQGSRTAVWVALEFEKPVVDPERASTFELPDRHRLVVRFGEERRVVVPGDTVDLPDGRLIYQGLRSWMGYTVFSDWTLPWLLATCCVATLSLGWHFWRKFAPRPWLSGE